MESPIDRSFHKLQPTSSNSRAIHIIILLNILNIAWKKKAATFTANLRQVCGPQSQSLSVENSADAEKPESAHQNGTGAKASPPSSCYCLCFCGASLL